MVLTFCLTKPMVLYAFEVMLFSRVSPQRRYQSALDPREYNEKLEITDWLRLIYETCF